MLSAAGRPVVAMKRSFPIALLGMGRMAERHTKAIGRRHSGASKPVVWRPDLDAGSDGGLPLEQGKIGKFELLTMVLMFGMGSSMLMASGGVGEHEAWLAMLMATGESLLFALVFMTLAGRFPGKTMIEINDIVYGPYLGKAVSAVFLWYLLHFASLILKSYTDSFLISFLTDTPSLVIAIALILICALATRQGLEVIARCSQALLPLVMLMYTVWTIVAFPRLDWGNSLPLVDIALTRLLWDANSLTAFFFADLVCLLMIVPSMKEAGPAKSAIYIGIMLSGVLSSLALFIDSGILGPIAGTSLFPTLEVSKLINIPLIEVPMDLLLFVVFIPAGFIRIAIYLYGIVLGLAQLLKGRSYRVLTWPVAILVLLLSMLNFTSLSEEVDFIRIGAPLYKLPVALGIPLVSLLLALIRGLPRRPDRPAA